MPFNFPTFNQIVSKADEDIIRGDGTIIEPDKKINPNIRNSFARIYVRSMSGAMYDLYRVGKYILQEAFLTTAIDTLEDRGKKQYNITRRGSTPANGLAVFTGVVGNLVPVGTFLTSGGNQYILSQNALIQTSIIIIQTLTRIGQKAIATTANPHNLASGLLLTISGADQSEYNVVNAEITILSETQFQYNIEGLPITPATGAIQANVDIGLANIQSAETGSNQNIDYTGILQINTGIAGINDTVRITFGGITGGLDIEDLEDYRIRVLDKLQNNLPRTSEAGIRSFLQDEQQSGISGITRVWVQHATPEPGKMTIYFVRDDLENIYPSPSVINQAHEAIVKRENGLITPVTPDNYIIVASPTPKVVNFTFTSFEPNINTLKEAVKENLQFLFSQNANLGQKIPAVRYINVIMSTTDDAGNAVEDFTLLEPIGDIEPLPNELPELGVVV